MHSSVRSISLLLGLIGCFLPALDGFAQSVGQAQRENQTEWGSDHTELGLPPYVTGDECLFCHRDIGPSWGENRHQLTMRPISDLGKSLRESSKLNALHAPIAEAQFTLGERQATYLLRRSQAYGKLDLFSARIDRKDGQVSGTTETDAEHLVPHWDQTQFAERCAGCHATAVDVRTRAFSATSLDCFVCHGDVPLGHTSDIGQVFLSKTSRDPKHVISICGQCHLRGGQSKSTSLPYPNSFVAGDNLFKDFELDLSPESWESRSFADHHVFQNSYETVVAGDSKLTCVSCHSVHQQNSEMHQGLGHESLCNSCHLNTDDYSVFTKRWIQVMESKDKSHVCDY